MAEKVLITGGSGLVGTRLTEILQENGYEVAWLVRSKSSKQLQQFIWNVREGSIDPEATTWADHIIHLAGASVAEGRWTKERKKEILDSRIQSTKLLVKVLANHPHHVKSFVSASAMGYYGSNTGEEWIEEDHPAGKDFLAKVTKEWEHEVICIERLGIKEVRIRIGIVMTTLGGALPQMMLPIKFGLGSPLGSGKQYMSWIHIDDLCHIFMESLRHEQYHGTINASASQPVKNKEFMKGIANAMHKPFFLPPVPGFLLRIVLGEKAIIATGGCRLCNKKLISKGFQFKYDDLDKALQNLIR